MTTTQTTHHSICTTFYWWIRDHIISNETNDVSFIKPFLRKVLYACVLMIPRNIVINTKPVQKQESSTGSKKRTQKRQTEKVMR